MKEAKSEIDMHRCVGIRILLKLLNTAISGKINRYQGRTCFIEFVFHPEYDSMILLVTSSDDQFDGLGVCSD